MKANESLFENYSPSGEILKIYTYPSPVLKKVAVQVEEFDDELKKLCFDLLNTMYKTPGGIGLAAPQVGVSKRIFVMDLDFKREEVTKADGSIEKVITNFKPLVFINPKITNKVGHSLEDEGCLSFPGLYEKVERASEISVEFQDMEGNIHSIDADDLLSICVQHENDHLDGIVFIDRLSLLKKNMLIKRYQKRKKLKERETSK